VKTSKAVGTKIENTTQNSNTEYTNSLEEKTLIKAECWLLIRMLILYLSLTINYSRHAYWSCLNRNDKNIHILQIENFYKLLKAIIVQLCNFEHYDLLHISIITTIRV